MEKKEYGGVFNPVENTFTDDHGQTISNVHSSDECSDFCVIHNPSKHRLSGLPLRIRFPGPWDIKPLHFERICDHGVGHPDPDDMTYWRSRGEDSMGIHGCCGCCFPKGDL